MSLHITPYDIINRIDDLKHPQNQKRLTNETKVHSKNEKTDMTIKTLKKILEHSSAKFMPEKPLTTSNQPAILQSR